MIKTIRKALGMSIAKLSEYLEMPAKTMENWEYGNSKTPLWAEKLIVEKLTRDFNLTFRVCEIISRIEVVHYGEVDECRTLEENEQSSKYFNNIYEALKSIEGERFEPEIEKIGGGEYEVRSWTIEIYQDEEIVEVVERDNIYRLVEEIHSN